MKANLFTVVLLGTPLLSACGWMETTRVEKDFGNSVRVMIAEQLYNPDEAKEPTITAPESLGGTAASAAIEGYISASEQARTERTRNTASPLPVVGTTSGSTEE